MAFSSDYVNSQDYSRILGIPLDSDKPKRPLKVTPDTTAWDVYNHHAGRVESERVKDWSNTLNTLLIFAGLYSTVLTAFIIESMKLLQEDSSDTTRDILLHISRQLAVMSTAAFNTPNPTFTAPQWALRVNYCFFFSLSCALITALAAVLALQWVGSYDRGLNPSSVESRALQRQFRMKAAKNWKLEHIISSLPTIIFISLLVFSVGLAEWLRHIHHNVAIIVTVGVSTGSFFYAVTTLASMLSVVAPFRTPTSRYLPLWLGLILKSISALFKRTRPVTTTVYTVITSIIAMMASPHIDVPIHVPENTDVAPQIHQKTRWEQLSGRVVRFIAPLYSIEPFEAREQKAVATNKEIKLMSLFWVAHSISIEPCHRQTLMLIMEAILEQPKRELKHDHINGKLWKLIFTELYVPYKGKKKWVDYSLEDLKNASLFVRGLSSIGQGLLDDVEFRDLVSAFYGTCTGIGEMYQTMKRWKLLDSESEKMGKSSLRDTGEKERESHGSQDNNNLNQLTRDEGLARLPHRAIDVPSRGRGNNGVGAFPLDEYHQNCREVALKNLDVALSFRDYFPLEFIVAALQRVKRDPSKLALITIEEMFQFITRHLHIERDDIASTHPLPFPVLDLVQETITTRLSGTVSSSLDPLAYSDTVKRHLTATNNEEASVAHQSAISAHEAIMEQAISNLVQIGASQVFNNPRIQEILVKLDQLAQCKFGQGKHTAVLALSSMINTEADIWNQSNRIYTAKSMLSLLKVEDSNFNGENWTVWWAEILPAFAKFIDDDELTESIVIKHGRRALLAHLPHRGQFSDDQITRLSTISHLGVRLFATGVTQSVTLAKSILTIDSTQRPKYIWKPSIAWMGFIDICFGQLNPQASGNEIFRRAFAVGSSLDLYDQIYDKDISRHINTPPDLFKYLSYPILPVILRHAESQRSTTLVLLNIIAKNEGFSAEFSKAEGFTWMPGFIRKNPAYFEEILGIIYQAISKCRSCYLAFMWIHATLECQETAISAIGDGDNQITAGVLWRYISKNASILMDHINARRKTGTVLQSRRNTAPYDAEEWLPAAESVKEATYIGKKLGLTVLEDEEKPKLDSTAPKEWSDGDKQSWRTLVDRVITGFEDIRERAEALTSYNQAYMLPRDDIDLLRRLTLKGPGDPYVYIYAILDEIIASTSMSAQYFRAPVLNRIMRMDSERIFEITRTLRDISEYDWFMQEFINADGLQLLPLRLIPVYLEETVDLVTNALSLSTTYKNLLLWLRLVYSCLNSVGIKLEGSVSRRFSMLDDARRNLDQFTILLHDMKRKWDNDRGYQPIDEALSGGDINNGYIESSLRLWSPGEWEDVQEIIEELLGGGLKRGYIMPAPSAAHQRFIRDPDGLCLYSEPQRVRIPSTRINLKKLPRDPDGICTSDPTFCG